MSRLWTGGLGNCVSIPWRSKKFSLLQFARTVSWAHRISHLLGNDGSFCGVKLLSVEIKNVWRYTLIPPYFFMVCTETTSPITNKVNWRLFSLRCPMDVILSWGILHLLFRTLNIKIFFLLKENNVQTLKINRL